MYQPPSLFVPFHPQCESHSEAPEYFSYKTNRYKLHCYETVTGKKFVMLTDTKAGSLHNELKDIYSNVYVENVVRNPLAQVNESIQECEPFATELNKHLRELLVWRTPA